MRRLRMGQSLRRVELDSIDIQNPPSSSFATTNGTGFEVRQGPNYAKTGAKGSSESSMLNLHSIDIVKTKRKCHDIMQYVDVPETVRVEDLVTTENGAPIPSLFVVNFMLPAYSPSNPLWGAGKYDGESYSVVLYMEVNEEAVEMMRQGQPNGAVLLERFFRMNTDCPSDYPLRSRLKAIPILMNPDDVKLGMALSRLVRSYTAKPFLTGPKYHSFVRGKGYLECDVDIHQYVYLARKTFHSLLSEVPSIVVDIGIVVEAQSDDEMPEHVLGSARISCVDPSAALELDMSDD